MLRFAHCCEDQTTDPTEILRIHRQTHQQEAEAGTFLAVLWMRSVLPMQGAWVHLLVRKLECHILHGEAKKKPRGLLDIGKKKCRQSLRATPPCRASAGGGLPGGGSGLWGHRVSPAEQILRRGPFPSSQKVPPLTSGESGKALTLLGLSFLIC